MRARSNLALAIPLALTIAGCAGGLDALAPRPDLGVATAPTRIEPADGGTASEGERSADDALAAPDATAPAPAPGCSDGTREGFLDGSTHPEIAGCSGGWSIPGILLPGGTRCGRMAGNAGSNPAGTGCAVDDLCAAGWHVCATAAEIAARSRTGCKEAVPPSAGEPLFFASRQSGPGYSQCGAGSNDVFGCGNLGGPPAPSCAPLDAYGNDHCALLSSPWACSGGAGGVLEALTVTKSGPAKGGVLCCRD